MRKLKIIIRLKCKGRDVTPHVSKHLKVYLRKNWGSPFIVAFMIMFMATEIYLYHGLKGVASEIAVYAYYSLVIGVVLQFLCYLKYGGSEV